MTVFDLTYNPFTKEKTFYVDGKEDDFDECWGGGSKELSEWSSIFFEKVYRKYNDSEMEVHFKGIIRDYEFLEDAKDAYQKENSSVTITLVDNECANTTEKLGELKELFEKMQKETPFEQLKTEELKRLFEKIVSSDFEMAVVATMSSGKSTLINAMLGRELLPARNEATTATLAKIHDIDGADHFTGKSYDKNHKEIVSCDPLELKNMNDLNDNPETSVIEIYGDVAGIESKNLHLVLTDTPGPNNSRTDEHKEHTYSLLTAEYKPMILYVLNGTQLETNDDNSLLNDVAKAMKSGGRQAQERFIFVLNKADEFDPAKGEDVPTKIKDVENYLAKHGIQNPRIFPAASRMAKVIRQYQNKQPLTETEEDDILPKYKTFIKREWKHFSSFAPLSSAAKKLQEEMLVAAQGKGGEEGDLAQALIYTGIPAIELAISEYLTKYALPAKITEGVYSFKEKIDNLGVEATEKEKLKGNKAEVEKQTEKLELIEKTLQSGEKAEEVKAKINEIATEQEVKEEFEKLSVVFLGEFAQYIQNMNTSKMTKDEAIRNLSKLQEFLPNSEMKFRIDIQNLLENRIRVQAENAISEYQKYLSELIGGDSYEIKPAAILGDTATITIDSVLDDYERSERVKVGSHREKESGFLGGLKRFFTFGHAGYYTVDDYENQEYIDFSEFIKKEIRPKYTEVLKSTEEIAVNWAKEESQTFKAFFIEKFNQLQDAIKLKLAEKLETLSNKERLEEMIKINEENLKWIEEFKKDLDSVLAL